MKLDEIGIWSEIKLDIIKEYANALLSLGNGSKRKDYKKLQDSNLFQNPCS